MIGLVVVSRRTNCEISIHAIVLRQPNSSRYTSASSGENGNVSRNLIDRQIDRQTYLYSAYKFKRVTKRLSVHTGVDGVDGVHTGEQRYCSGSDAGRSYHCCSNLFFCTFGPFAVDVPTTNCNQLKHRWPVYYTPVKYSSAAAYIRSMYQSIPIRDSNRFDSIRYANRFEPIRFVKKIGISIHQLLCSFCTK